MSFLAWAFGLGALAVAFPLIFHLIRRTPKGRQEFSSLMFLRPSPPRLTRRSRLDNILLLLLRAAIIALLAFAFMRPFFREQVNLISADIPARRIAILLDTSASMRSGDLWNSASEQVRDVLSKLEPSDDVGLFTFDSKITTIVDFEKDIQVASEQKYQLIRSELDKIQPTYASTDLARALTALAESMDIDNESAENAAALQIVLISDMQDGALVDALQEFQWPKSVRVDVRPIKTKNNNNASLHVMKPANRTSEAGQARVRVTNAANSKSDQFYVAFTDLQKIEPKTAIPFYVPPGTSRVLQVPYEVENSDRVALGGDQITFDNQYFIVPPQQRQSEVIYFGDEETDDANEMLYYLQRTFPETPHLRVDFKQITGDDEPSPTNKTDLVVVTKPLTSKQQSIVDKYLKKRGTVLVVVTDEKQLVSLNKFIGSPTRIDTDPTAPKAQYSLIAQLDFTHPLIAPLSSPRYNDFTKIHFWKHFTVQLPASEKTHVIATFDDDTPALWQTQYESGNVYTLTSAWDPKNSQLALDADKFVPIMSTLLQLANRTPVIRDRYTINQAIKFPTTETPVSWAITRPDGKIETISSSESSYNKTDIPGVYEMKSSAFDEKVFRFAVNIATSESQTAPMPIEKLKMHNVLIGQQDTRKARIQQLQKLKDREIENRQKIWKWLVVSAFVFLLVETWLAGRKKWNTAPANDLQTPQVVTQ